ncbi:MAG: hypothetical protein ACLUFM_06120, partial [Lachnospiraceae bacterium]
DIFCKDMPGYTLSDSYDLVQSVALFLCGHCGEYLDDLLYISKKGKQITIKMECYLIITRMLSKRYRLMQKYQGLEEAKEKSEINYMEETGLNINRKAKKIANSKMTAALNLTENMSVALDTACRDELSRDPWLSRAVHQYMNTSRRCAQARLSTDNNNALKFI